MSYFETSNNLDELLKGIGDVCLDELMLSSDAYIRMIELNFNGFKRLHRSLSKKFHDLYLRIQKISLEMNGKPLSNYTNYTHYSPKNIEEHLETWTEKLDEHYTKVSSIIVSLFNISGEIPECIKELQHILYFNKIKNQRTIRKFEDCEWEYDVIYEYDKHLHHKMKEESHL